MQKIQSSSNTEEIQNIDWQAEYLKVRDERDSLQKRIETLEESVSMANQKMNDFSNRYVAVSQEYDKLRIQRNALLEGIEDLGWPCRLVELPEYAKILGLEVMRLRDHIVEIEKEHSEFSNRIVELEGALAAEKQNSTKVSGWTIVAADRDD